jgi:hypothetical protein
MLKIAGIIGLGLFAGVIATTPALAKSARCFTTDDGYYDCQFEIFDDAGSFEISAPGYPSFQLTIDSPGFAYASAVYPRGGRSVSLPGMYVRSRDDGACWNNPETSTKLCAW